MKTLLVLLALSLTLFANGYPTLFAQLGTPLYEANGQLQALAQQETLKSPLLIYNTQCRKILAFGQKAALSADKQQKNAYLKKLRKLQKSYDDLAALLQKQTFQTIKTDDYELFMTMVNTEADLFFQKPKLKEAIYHYYNKHKNRERSPSLSKRIKKERQTVVRYNTGTSTFSSFSDKQKSKQTRTQRPKANRNDVTVLSTPSCPYCRKAKSFLAKNHVSFTDYNVNSSTEGKRLYRKYGGSGVPIVIINGSVIKGYSAQAMRSALH